MIAISEGEKCGEKREEMLEILVNAIFRWKRLRLAIFDEVHMYDHLDKILADPEAMAIGSSFWPDVDGWRGWTKEGNKYYFNDIPEENIIDAITQLDKMSEFVEFTQDELW